ncbi:MAG: hypothetical protein GT600_11345 [Bacteroidales bacterium]|jgi:hypothetical protein|nr:hypothetical protein [Bacteroidales bacterium]
MFDSLDNTVDKYGSSVYFLPSQAAVRNVNISIFSSDGTGDTSGRKNFMISARKEL